LRKMDSRPREEQSSKGFLERKQMVEKDTLVSKVVEQQPKSWAVLSSREMVSSS